MGSSMVDVKVSGQTLWQFKVKPNLVLGIWIRQFNGQDKIVRTGNYCWSSVKVASIDENKNSHRKITMTQTQTICPNRIVLCTSKKKGARCKKCNWQSEFKSLNIWNHNIVHKFGMIETIWVQVICIRFLCLTAYQPSTVIKCQSQLFVLGFFV